MSVALSQTPAMLRDYTHYRYRDHAMRDVPVYVAFSLSPSTADDGEPILLSENATLLSSC